jgi:indole-3-glycerol phosphate synthase
MSTPVPSQAAQTMPSVLERIVAAKRQELAAAQARTSQAELERLAARAPAPRPFARALVRDCVALIAEIKRASPSKGAFAPGLVAEDLARAYEANGAACCSVLTDIHFQGSLEDLQRVRAAVSLPLLRKDFLFEPYQLYEARAAGADAVLLIVSVVQYTEALGRLIELAGRLGMDALVEVHNPTEVQVALAAGATLIGINNRDLRTFQTDRAVTARLRPLIPAEVLVVSESGIFTAAHVHELALHNVQAVLVGEALVTAPDIAAKVRELAGVMRPHLLPPLPKLQERGERSLPSPIAWERGRG